LVKLDKIYTGGGDGGETSLAGGKRVQKHDPRVAAYGTVDEANAVIGIAQLHNQCEGINEVLARIQNDLFDLGADLARPTLAGEEALRITAGQVERLENEIDQFNAPLAPLPSFVLPGGTPASAYLHLARTVVRRAERLTVSLTENEIVNPFTISYLNRLSDLLFVLARVANDGGAKDVLWTPGEHGI